MPALSTPSAPSSPGLRRGLALVSLLAQHGCVGFADLRRALDDVAAPTLSRLLKVLQEEGWVAGGDHGYVLGQQALALTGSGDQLARCQSVVERLAHSTGESAAWVRWDTDAIVFECACLMPDSYHYLPVGSRNSSPENGFVVAGMHLSGRAQSVALAEQLAADEVVIHRDRGLRVVAPVRVDGELLGLVGVSVLVARLRASERARFIAAVRDAAAAITNVLASSSSSQKGPLA